MKRDSTTIRISTQAHSALHVLGDALNDRSLTWVADRIIVAAMKRVVTGPPDPMDGYAGKIDEAAAREMGLL